MEALVGAALRMEQALGMEQGLGYGAGLAYGYGAGIGLYVHYTRDIDTTNTPVFLAGY